METEELICPVPSSTHMVHTSEVIHTAEWAVSLSVKCPLCITSLEQSHTEFYTLLVVNGEVFSQQELGFPLHLISLEPGTFEQVEAVQPFDNSRPLITQCSPEFDLAGISSTNAPFRSCVIAGPY